MRQLTFECAGCLGYLSVKTTFELLGIGSLLTSSWIGLFDKAPLTLTYYSHFIFICTKIKPLGSSPSFLNDSFKLCLMHFVIDFTVYFVDQLMVIITRV